MKQASEEITETPPSISTEMPSAARRESGGGTNGEDHLLSISDTDLPPEVRAAHDLARRYRLRYVDLLPPEGDSPIDFALLGELPVDLMVRYQFVPLRREG